MDKKKHDETLPNINDLLPRFVTAKHIQDALNLSRGAFYRLKRNDTRFPQPFIRTPLRWRHSEIVAYMSMVLNNE
jgi:predicted DNA-binding transcriptional regulator AlpA